MLRQESRIKTLNTKDTDIRQLTELMVGKPVNLSIEKAVVERGRLRFVQNLCVLGEHHVRVLDDINLSCMRVKSGWPVWRKYQKELYSHFRPISH